MKHSKLYSTYKKLGVWYIEDSDISPDDKYAALGYVTDKIAELVEKIIIKEI